MTISYPLTMPSNNLKRVNLYAVSSVAMSRNPWTFKQQVQANSGQAWGAEVTLPIMTRADAELWQAFLLKLNGQQGTFLLMVDPHARSPRGNAYGTPVVNGANQTGQTLITSGWGAGATLLEGDYIQLPGYHLHKVIQAATADGSGNMTIDIWPRIRVSPGNGEAITTESAIGTFRLSENTVPVMNVAEDGNYAVGFSAVEAL